MPHCQPISPYMQRQPKGVAIRYELGVRLTEEFHGKTTKSISAQENAQKPSRSTECVFAEGEPKEDTSQYKPFKNGFIKLRGVACTDFT